MARALSVLCLAIVTTLLGGCLGEESGPTGTAVPAPATVARPSLITPSPLPSPSPSPPPEGQTYTVRAGDTLSSIALMFYADPEEWRLIFEANRDRLTGPDALQVGLTLRIPPRPRQ